MADRASRLKLVFLLSSGLRRADAVSRPNSSHVTACCALAAPTKRKHISKAGLA